MMAATFRTAMARLSVSAVLEYGLGGALRAPLGPVVAPLVPRCALLPAPTPRMMGLRQLCTFQIPKRCTTRRDETFRVAVSALRAFRGRLARRGGSPREGVQSTPKRGSPRGVGSEARAEQRLAAGGAAPPTRMTVGQMTS